MLTYAAFQKVNRKRCEEAFHDVGTDSWSLDRWCLAIAGEVGELCNLVKKCIRGDFTIEEKREEILAELADITTYVDLAFSHMEANHGEELMKKFIEVSERVNWKHNPSVELMSAMGQIDQEVEKSIKE